MCTCAYPYSCTFIIYLYIYFFTIILPYFQGSPDVEQSDQCKRPLLAHTSLHHFIIDVSSWKGSSFFPLTLWFLFDKLVMKTGPRQGPLPLPLRESIEKTFQPLLLPGNFKHVNTLPFSLCIADICMYMFTLCCFVTIPPRALHASMHS